MKYYIVDTSSLLRLLRRRIVEDLLEEGYIAISGKVLEEIRDKESKLLFNISSDKISVINPMPTSLRVIKEKARKLGISCELSETDLSVVALAWELREQGYDIIVLTEDYSIQNLCKALNLEIMAISRGEIQYILRTLKKCLVCDAIYDSQLSECPHCGSTRYKIIKRRIRK